MRVSLLIVLSLFFASAALAQDAKLLAEAKKEGKVVIYGSMETGYFRRRAPILREEGRHPG